MPLLKSLTIHGYRGFATPGTLRLAVPNGSPGSGLTVLVGANNSGKSSIVEALSFLARPTTPPVLDAARRNGITGGVFRVDFDGEAGISSLFSESGAEVTWSHATNPFPHGKVFVVQSRRTLPRMFSRSGAVEREAYAAGGIEPAIRTSSSSNFAGRLAAILANRRAFDAILEAALGEAPRWYVEELPGGSRQSFLNFCAGTSPHDSEGIGDGFTTLVFVADALYDSKEGDVIVLDEPELSLQPAIQRKLAAIISDFAKTRQIVIATHSPHFARWEDVFNGAQVARVHLKDRGSAIGNLERETVERVKKLAGNNVNPHILGLDAREVFFLSDRVVLVEGSDDVIDYPELAAKLKMQIAGEFYGWGVGGAGNMPTIAAVLRDLGFERVAGILDSGQEHLLAKLHSECPQYAFAAISAENVRSKQAEKARDAKAGLLDEKRRVRSDVYEECAILLNQLNEYLLNGTKGPMTMFGWPKLPQNVHLHILGLPLPTAEDLGEPLRP